MQSVIIDTDIAIDYLRGKQHALNLVSPLWSNNRAYLSILSVYELFAGMKDDEGEYTENFINACNIELVTVEIAKKGGELYRHYREQGLTLTSIDCLVNATAIVKGYKIATKNKQHYPDENIIYQM